MVISKRVKYTPHLSGKESSALPIFSVSVFEFWVELTFAF